MEIQDNMNCEVCEQNFSYAEAPYITIRCQDLFACPTCWKTWRDTIYTEADTELALVLGARRMLVTSDEAEVIFVPMTERLYQEVLVAGTIDVGVHCYWDKQTLCYVADTIEGRYPEEGTSPIVAL